MISAYSINFPALAALTMLVMTGLYHLWSSRKQEFETVIFPSTLKLGQDEIGLTLENNKDVAINCHLKVDQLVCRNLYIGPKGVVEGRIIHADRVVVEGEIRQLEQLQARVEFVNRRSVEIFKIQTPKLLLGRKSISVIQIVPQETQVIRKRSAQSRGFFASLEELEQNKNGSTRQRTLASIRAIRKTPR